MPFESWKHSLCVAIVYEIEDLCIPVLIIPFVVEIVENTSAVGLLCTTTERLLWVPIVHQCERGLMYISQSS